MRRVGRLLMGIGAMLGVVDVLAIGGLLGFPGVPWIVNVALVKLGLVAAGGLMAAGAAVVRFGRHRDQQALASSERSTEQLPRVGR